MISYVMVFLIYIATLTLPSVYSYFAFCEYVMILTNIAFHATIFIDLEGLSLVAVRLPDHAGMV